MKLEQKPSKGCRVGSGLFFVLFIFLSTLPQSRAENKKEDSDEYNFSWLDPDKKIYVLQNRKYEKSGHPLISLMGGVGFSNPYKNAYNIDPRFSYFITEYLGVELFYTFTENSSNSILTALSTASPNALPSVREIRNQLGGMILYVPWYAKINVFNSILYFDWYFGAGVGKISSFVDTKTSASAASKFVADDLIGIMASTGHQYHLSQLFVFRVDVTAAFYQAKVNGLTGDSTWYSNYNFALGLGVRL